MSKLWKTTAGKGLLGVLAVAVIAAAVLLLRAEEGYRTIVVEDMEGQSLISNEKNQMDAYVNMALFSGDRVQVMDSAYLALQLDGDKHMLAESGTEFSLEASGVPGSDKTVIHMESGAVLIRLKNKLDEDQDYVVNTPTSVISVRGTVFYIKIETDAKNEVVVMCSTLDGTVEIQPVDKEGNPSQEPVLLSPGETVGVEEIGISSDYLRNSAGEPDIREVDYEELPEPIVRRLISYAEDGEELIVDQSFLEELLEEIVHQHSFSEEWSYDGECHWHEAVCEHKEERADLEPHSFGDWHLSEADVYVHERVCGCGAVETAEHEWNEGEVTSEPTEEEAGIRTYTCIICGCTKEENIAALSHTHTWSEGWSHDNYGHWHESTCQHMEVLRRDEAAHDWVADQVIREATHFEEGTTAYICTVCGAVREEAVPETDEHVFGGWTVNDDDSHSRFCRCGVSQSAEHAFDKGAEGKNPDGDPAMVYTCLTCGYKRYVDIPHQHVFGGKWIDGQTGHYRICTGCKTAVSEEEPHCYDQWQPQADNAACHEKRCSDCGSVQIGQHQFDAGVKGTDSNGIIAIVYTCGDCGYMTYSEPSIAGLTGSFALDGTGYTDWYDAMMAMSGAESSKKVYLLSDVTFSDWGGISLPYENSSSDTREDVPAFYQMTLDLNGKHLNQGTIAPRVYEGTVWTITGTNGGFLETAGRGVYNPDSNGVLGGTVVVTGGLFDFDPTEYVPEGYTVETLIEPKITAGSDWSARENGQTGNTGLWVVYADDFDKSSCTHNTYKYIRNSETGYYEYCSACGRRDGHEHEVRWDFDLPMVHKMYCAVCDELTAENGPHVFDDGVLSGSEYTYTCQVCGYQKISDCKHVYEQGAGGYQADLGIEASVFTCLYCSDQIAFEDHQCQAAGSIGYDERGHWENCAFEGCPGHYSCGEHSVQLVHTASASHDTPGLAHYHCSYCGRSSEDVEIEFSGYIFDFSACGQPEFSQHNDNYLALGEPFDGSLVKVIGVYTDSYDPATGELLYSRQLSADEYELATRMAYDHGTEYTSAPADLTSVGNKVSFDYTVKADGTLLSYEVRVIYAKAQGVFFALEMEGYAANVSAEQCALKIGYEMDNMYIPGQKGDHILTVNTYLDGIAAADKAGMYNEVRYLMDMLGPDDYAAEYCGHVLRINGDDYVGTTADSYRAKLTAADGYRVFAVASQEYETYWKGVDCREITDFGAVQELSWTEHIAVVNAEALDAAIAENGYDPAAITSVQLAGLMSCLSAMPSTGIEIKVEPHWHTGGAAADCQTQAVCESCNEQYGTFGPHDPELSEYGMDSTDHWNLCRICGESCNKGAHTGGTATYYEAAACDVCKGLYGTVVEFPAVPTGNILEVQMGEVTDTVPDPDLVANKIGLAMAEYDADWILKATAEIDGVPMTSSEKYGLKYEYYDTLAGKANGYLFIRSKIYNHTEGSYPVSFTAMDGYHVLLCHEDGTLTQIGDTGNASISRTDQYILAVRESMTAELLAASSFSAEDFIARCKNYDPYGGLVLIPVFDETDFLLDIGDSTVNIIQDAAAVYTLEFDYWSGRYIGVGIGLAATESLGGGTTSAGYFTGYSLGGVSKTEPITSDCQEGHTDHETVAGNLITNDYLNPDGSSTIRFRDSAVALPAGTAADGSYTHFAESWYNDTVRRIFFYFTVDHTAYCYYADLATAENDLSAATQSCYDKNTAADFGWTEDAQNWYDEYFGNGGHTGIAELTGQLQP